MAQAAGWDAKHSPSRAQRRRKLRRLDDILDGLEQLNLQNQETVPRQLVDAMKRHGVEPLEATVPQLIERVWKAQQPYLVQLPAERRRASRRSRQVYDVDSVIQAIVLRLQQAP